jgi:hypothetical protein
LALDEIMLMPASESTPGKSAPQRGRPRVAALNPLLLLFLFCLSFASRSYAAAPTVIWPQPTPPPGAIRATYPVPRIDWLFRFQQNLDKLKSGPYDLILDGDSITDFWQTRGAEVWKAHFGGIKMADFAISGDQVQHVLWRLQHGELEGQDPKLIELMIGTNNGGEDPKEIAEGIQLLIHEYETRCPHAHILLLGVFPRGAAGDLSRHRRQVPSSRRLPHRRYHARFSASLPGRLRDLGQRDRTRNYAVFSGSGSCRAGESRARRKIIPTAGVARGKVVHTPLTASSQ